MAFRLRDDTELILPLPECDECIGKALADVLPLFDKREFQLFKDFEGENGYRLIAMTGLLCMIDIIAYRQNDTDDWVVVDAIVQRVLQRH